MSLLVEAVAAFYEPQGAEREICSTNKALLVVICFFSLLDLHSVCLFIEGLTNVEAAMREIPFSPMLISAFPEVCCSKEWVLPGDVDSNASARKQCSTGQLCITSSGDSTCVDFVARAANAYGFTVCSRPLLVGVRSMKVQFFLKVGLTLSPH
jgi:hypothetical protein